MTLFREPGFVRNLRAALAARKSHLSVHTGGFHVDDATLLSLVATPSTLDSDVVDHVDHGALDMLPWTGHSACSPGNVCDVFVDEWALKDGAPLELYTDRWNRSVMEAVDTEFGVPAHVTGLSLELNPDMSLTTFRYQTGGIDLLPEIARLDADHVFFLPKVQWSYVCSTDLINRHLERGNDVTWGVVRRTHDNPRPIPVWVNGRIVLRDPQDLPDRFDASKAEFVSSAVFAVSMRLIRRIVNDGMPRWAWRRRRVDEHGIVTIRFVRDLHELTSLDGIKTEIVRA